MDDDDSIESFDNLFEPFGLEGGPEKKGDPQPRRTQPPRQTRQVSPQTTIACVSCGSANDPENRHCERCGARLARTQMPVAPQPMLRTTAGARALIVLATVVLGVALLALLVNLFSGGDGSASETSSTTSTSLATVPIAEVHPIRVTCTSELTSFPCAALADGDAATSWNATDGGLGAEITFLFSPPVQITEMLIQNIEDECRFLRNARMRGIEVLVDDLTQTTVKELDDSRDPQRVDIRSLRTSSLTIRITSGYPGQICDDREAFLEMAAQDVFFYGRPTPGG
ncbi:MAG: discoidin domain-containing protein [Actinomycetota bacterium]